MDIVSVRNPAGASWLPYTTGTTMGAGFVSPLTPAGWGYQVQDYAVPLFSASGNALGVATGRRIGPSNPGFLPAPWACVDACGFNSPTRRLSIAMASAAIPFGPDLTTITTQPQVQSLLMVRSCVARMCTPV
jgi:hypothetical protein